MLAADRRVRRVDSRVFMGSLRIYEWTNGQVGKSANLQIAMVGQVYHRWG